MINLVTKLENRNKNVNTFLFWDGGHCVDNDLQGLLMGSEILPVINQMIVGDVQNISSIDDRLKLNFETDNINCTIKEA